MTTRTLLPVLGSVAFFLGYGRSEAELDAAVPAVCKIKFACKTVHAMWEAPQDVQAYYDGANPTTHAALNIFATTCIEKGPDIAVILAPATYDLWIFTACTPSCGKMGLNWQSPQEVSEDPAAVKEKSKAGPFNRKECTKTKNGENAEQSADQNNGNRDGAIPPGVDDDGEPLP